MFECPIDQRPLQRHDGPNGDYWSCPTCYGHAVSLERLRRTTANELVDRIWTAAGEQRVAHGHACPCCSDLMHEVSSGPSGPAVDVCRVCRLVWFDPTEYEQIRATSVPVPRLKLPEPPEPADEMLTIMRAEERATEILVTAQVEAITERMRNEFSRLGPDEKWKRAAAWRGWPFETEESVFRSIPWLTWAIIAFTVAFNLRAFLNLPQAVTQFGLIPAEPLRHFGLTLFTSFLLHGGPSHLIGNMYFLSLFGERVEDYLGKVRYLLLIALAVVFGDVAHIALDWHAHVPVIGASGGISGIMAFYALRFPKAKLGILLGPQLFRVVPWYMGHYLIGAVRLFRWIKVPAYAYLGSWIVFQLVGAYYQMVGATSVSALAHLGGAATALVFWLVCKDS